MPDFTQAEPAMSCAMPAVGPCEIVLYRDPAQTDAPYYEQGL